MIQVKGFAPANLIVKLAAAKWRRCDDGRNFEAIELAGYCLTQPADELCSQEYRVSVRDEGTRTEYTISGFCYRSMPRVVALGTQATRICGQLLRKRRAKGLVPYTLTVR